MTKPPRQLVMMGRRSGKEASMVAALAYAQYDPLRVVVWGPNGRAQARVRLAMLKLQRKPRLP